MPPPERNDERLQSPAREQAARQQDEPAVPDRNKFPRSARITRKKVFQHVFKHGNKVVGRYFVCYLVQCEGQGSKLGFAVSRKVGNAVVRNRVKRYLREYFRTHGRDLTAPVALVFVARPPSAGLDYATCAQSLRNLLQRGGVLHG